MLYKQVIGLLALAAATSQLHIKGSSKSSRKFDLDKTEDKKEVTRETLNIGLIAPHTNFGKREYSRAINSALLSLSKMRGATKTGITNNTIFSAQNVHFDMMSLTPSPTGMCSYFLSIEYIRIAIYAFVWWFDSTYSYSANHVPSILESERFSHYLSDELRTIWKEYSFRTIFIATVWIFRHTGHIVECR